MKKLLNVMHKNHEGFTLVELMIVVVIIGILVAIAIPIYGTITESAERTAVEANLRTVDGAVMMYRAEHEAYPVAEGEEGDVNDLLGDYVEEFDPAATENYSLRWKIEEADADADTDDRVTAQEDLGEDDRPYGYFTGDVGGINTGTDYARLPISEWDNLDED